MLIDGPLTFLDSLIMQGDVIHVIILHVHVAHPGLCLCMSGRTGAEHTSSSCARAKGVDKCDLKNYAV